MTALMLRARNGSRGQTLVEFAIVIPLFLVLLIAVFDIGRVVWATSSLQNAAREAARWAIVHGGSKSTPCPVGPMVPDITPPAPSASCPYPSPSKEGVRDVARNYAIAIGANLVVDVCYGPNCTGSVDAAGATNARGTPMTVTVTSQVDLVATRLLGLASFPLSGSATMLVNH